MIQGRETELLALRSKCEDPWTDLQHESRCTASLLPEPALLDGLIRYETHTDRTLYRALDQLAKLRGISVDKLIPNITPNETDTPILKVDGRPALLDEGGISQQIGVHKPIARDLDLGWGKWIVAVRSGVSQCLGRGTDGLQPSTGGNRQREDDSSACYRWYNPAS